ncbi:hypothetical protein [Streptomyces sp. HYC2]|uniref:hypothetical protein n=1 Tax=Streptomyces sp. HYC2 TaxID=2955207 RepID=UPI002480D4D5|nr:hypothetical protein [Streptomyces sp. HYC2]
MAVITTVGGGVFGLITAVAPALLTSDGKDDKPSVQASETPGRAVPSATATPPTNQPAESGSPSSSDDPVPSASLSSDSKPIQYTGLVRISSSWLNLDVVPPKSDSSHFDVSLGLVSPPQIDGSLALWTGSGMPNRQQCSDLLSTQGMQRVEVKKGTVVCLQTEEGRIAVLTITSTSNDFDTGEMAQVTVWSEVSD